MEFLTIASKDTCLNVCRNCMQGNEEAADIWDLASSFNEKKYAL
jgi:hypothetical protein